MAENNWDKRYKGKNLNMFGNPIHKPTKKYKEGWDRIFKKKKEMKTESEKMQDELEPIVTAPMMDKE